jgi:hypothetical protein
VYAEVRANRKAVDLVEFMENLVKQLLEEKHVHVIWDNLNIHFDGPDKRWTKFNARVGSTSTTLPCMRHGSTRSSCFSENLPRSIFLAVTEPARPPQRKPWIVGAHRSTSWMWLGLSGDAVWASKRRVDGGILVLGSFVGLGRRDQR